MTSDKTRIKSKNKGADELILKTRNLWNRDEWDTFIKENMVNLIKENELVKTNPEISMRVLTTEVAYLMISVCTQLNVCNETKYIAVDLFNRFYELHLKSLISIIKDTTTPENQNSLIKSVVNRVMSQSPLRALSCLQIASKITNHKKTITPKFIKKALEKTGHEYSLKSINKSEIRILQQLQFKCHSYSSLLDYIGTIIALVEIKDRNSPSVDSSSSIITDGQLYLTHCTQAMKDIDEVLLEASVNVIDLFLIHHNRIYEEVFYQISGSRIVIPKFRHAFLVVESDRVLCSCGIVAAAAWIIGNEHLRAKTTRLMSTAVHIQPKDINVMCDCILKYCIKS